MNYLVYCDVDKNGNITEAFTGVNIIPPKQYGHFFLTKDEGVLTDIHKYKVDLETRQLTVK